MAPIKIAVAFSVISSLVLLSQARHGLDDFSSAAAVTVRDPPEDTDRKAIVPLEESSSSDESIPPDEGFQHVVALSLRDPIDLSLRRPIDHQFLPREIPDGGDTIGLPSGLPSEMRSIETKATAETQDDVGGLEEAMAQDLTEVNAKEVEGIPVEWMAAEEEEEHRRKKKKRDHKKKKEKEEDSDSDSDSDDSDSDSDDDDEEMNEIRKKKKKCKKHEKERKEGGWLKRLWAAFLSLF